MALPPFIFAPLLLEEVWAVALDRLASAPVIEDDVEEEEDEGNAAAEEEGPAPPRAVRDDDDDAYGPNE